MNIIPEDVWSSTDSSIKLYGSIVVEFTRLNILIRLIKLTSNGVEFSELKLNDLKTCLFD